jgi:hypothetical protein
LRLIARLSTVLLTIAATLLLASAAGAVSGTSVIADCNSHDTLTRTYPVAALEDALRTMPADVKEYTDCPDVIQRALLSEEGKLHGASGAPVAARSGGSFLPTPVIVVLAALAVCAIGLAIVALRSRSSDS